MKITNKMKQQKSPTTSIKVEPMREYRLLQAIIVIAFTFIYMIYLQVSTLETRSSIEMMTTMRQWRRGWNNVWYERPHSYTWLHGKSKDHHLILPTDFFTWLNNGNPIWQFQNSNILECVVYSWWSQVLVPSTGSGVCLISYQYPNIIDISRRYTYCCNLRDEIFFSY